MAYIFGSIWDRFNRNALNELSKSVEQQGKSIQDVVAEGQLTEDQFAELLTAINGLVKKADTGVLDLDVFNEDTRRKILDMEPGTINAVLGRGNVEQENISYGGVSITHTDFSYPTKNLFTGYYNGMISFLARPGQDMEFYLRENYDTNGKVTIIPISPNETYTIKVHEDFDFLRVAVNNSLPAFETSNETPLDSLIFHSTSNHTPELTFTNTEQGTFLIINVSDSGKTPKIQIEKGNTSTNYVPPKIISEEYVSIKDDVLIENPNTGYPPRPNLNSVIWIGVNEPTEPEPFDEWRQTEGFTHFNDFEQYEIDSIPSDWDIEWNSPQTFKVTYSQDLDEKRLEIKNATNSFFFASWANINNDDFRGDSEIYLKGQLSSVPDGAALQSVHRGGGVIGSETGYAIGVRNTLGNNFYISKIVDGSSNIIHSHNFEIDLTLPYHQVSRIDGNRLRVKVWQEGQNEPKEWSIDIVDANPLSQTGKIGVYCYMHHNRNFLYSFGVGTGGMRAPRRKVL